MARLISGISILLSIVALAIAVAAYRGADEKAQRAVRERERLLIERLNPQLQRIYADFRLTESPHAQNPQTVEEMIEPLIRLSEPASTRPATGGG